MIAGLVLILLCIVIVNLRFAVEYCFMNNKIKLHEKQTISEDLTMPVSVAVLLLTISDMIPIGCLIICIWISAKANWNNLIAAYLRRPGKQEESVECDSQFLVDLKRAHFDSELLGSDLIVDELHELDILGYSFDYTEITQGINEVLSVTSNSTANYPDFQTYELTLAIKEQSSNRRSSS
jgi:hypothetical protein